MIGGRVDLDLTPAEQLNKAGLRKALRIGVSRAASPVKASVVSHAAAVKKYGYLAKSIRVRLKSYPAERFVAVIGPSTKFTRQPRGKVTRGPNKGQKRPKAKPSKYAHLVERGTKRSKARPFLAPAHAETAAAFLDQAGAQIGREIESELARTKAKRAT